MMNEKLNECNNETIKKWMNEYPFHSFLLFDSDAKGNFMLKRCQVEQVKLMHRIWMKGEFSWQKNGCIPFLRFPTFLTALTFYNYHAPKFYCFLNRDEKMLLLLSWLVTLLIDYKWIIVNNKSENFNKWKILNKLIISNEWMN